MACAEKRFVGLRKRSSTSSTDINSLEVVDIGSMLNNLDGDRYGSNGYAFVDCEFCSIDGEPILVLTLSEEVSDGEDGETTTTTTKYSYLYFSESSYDKKYGFAKIEQVSVDGTIVAPGDVWTRVESLNALDTVNIVLTDYGFWDIEPNESYYRTWMYNGEKSAE